MHKIKMVCSVCEKIMGFKDGGKSPGLISHGLCEDCLEGEMTKQVTEVRTEEIRKLHGKFIESLKISLGYGIKIGELLTEQKLELKHGHFGTWTDENLPFSRRTAQNYMRLFRERDIIKNATVSHLTEAYRLLEDSKEDKQLLSDLTVDEIREIIKDINATINDKEYEVSEKTGWLFKGVKDDGSMSIDETIRYELAFNVYNHLCYFSHYIWNHGYDSLPAGLVRYVGRDPDSKLKLRCGGECRVDWEKAK